MQDSDCVAFLQWALPYLRMRWPGFRKVRRQVCRRIGRRLSELGLSDERDYRGFLETHPDEWRRLDSFCHISISRFYRDNDVFEWLGNEVLPALAEQARLDGRDRLRFWSAGCASGEEPYTLALVWHFALERRYPTIAVDITATDSNAQLIERAETACYPPSSVKRLPEAWVRAAFEREDSRYRLRPELREHVRFLHQDLRSEMPAPGWSLILCRNLAFTYFEASLQREILAALASALLPGGALVVGRRERLPDGGGPLRLWPGGARGIYRKRD